VKITEKLRKSIILTESHNNWKAHGRVGCRRPHAHGTNSRKTTSFDIKLTWRLKETILLSILVDQLPWLHIDLSFVVEQKTMVVFGIRTSTCSTIHIAVLVAYTRPQLSVKALSDVIKPSSWREGLNECKAEIQDQFREKLLLTIFLLAPLALVLLVVGHLIKQSTTNFSNRSFYTSTTILWNW